MLSLLNGRRHHTRALTHKLSQSGATLAATLVLLIATAAHVSAQAAPTPPTLPAESDCSSRATQILEAFRALPEDMSKLTGTALTQVHDAVDMILQQGPSFLTECSEHPDRSEVIHAVTRLMTLNFQRALLDAQKEGLDVMRYRDKYIDDIMRLVREGINGTADKALIKKHLKVQGHALYNRWTQW